MVLTRQIGITLASLIGGLAFLVFAPIAWGQTGADAVDEGPTGAPYAAGELIVTYQEEALEGEIQSAADDAGARVEKELTGLSAELLEFPRLKDERSQEVREGELDRIKRELEADPVVDSVYYNYVRTGSYTPNDPKFRHQYGLRKPGFEKAWSRARGHGARVAIVDSGAALGHVELRGKAVAKRDFVNDNNTVEDSHGHGTHVAGIVAARTGNRMGVAGGCPGCRLIVAKALNKDLVGYDSDIAAAIRWSADRGAKVINLSLGGPGEKSVLKDAIDYATRRGAVVVAAAGNSGSEAVYPAAYRNVIAVTATGPRDGRDRSYTTGRWIDVAAPGQDIVSTVPGGYEYKSGTSMSAPHVTALAGLLASQGRGPYQIRKRILGTAVDLGPRGWDSYYGAGRINADRATRRR